MKTVIISLLLCGSAMGQEPIFLGNWGYWVPPMYYYTEQPRPRQQRISTEQWYQNRLRALEAEENYRKRLQQVRIDRMEAEIENLKRLKELEQQMRGLK